MKDGDQNKKSKKAKQKQTQSKQTPADADGCEPLKGFCTAAVLIDFHVSVYGSNLGLWYFFVGEMNTNDLMHLCCS